MGSLSVFRHNRKGHEKAKQYSPKRRGAAFEAFRHTHPAYNTTRKLDYLRATEYARLDRQGQVYLDYTGGGLYAEGQLRQHQAWLGKGVYGNPHSKNLTSMAMTGLVEQTRDYVLKYFKASPEEYTVIFTPNATGALKLVGEAYPFGPGDHYLLTFDNHNSVNGIREFACSSGAKVTYLPVVLPELRVNPATLASKLEQASPKLIRPNPTFQACSTLWNGSAWLSPKVGRYC